MRDCSSWPYPHARWQHCNTEKIRKMTVSKEADAALMAALKKEHPERYPTLVRNMEQATLGMSVSARMQTAGAI